VNQPPTTCSLQTKFEIQAFLYILRNYKHNKTAWTTWIPATALQSCHIHTQPGPGTISRTSPTGEQLGIKIMLSLSQPINYPISPVWCTRTSANTEQSTYILISSTINKYTPTQNDILHIHGLQCSRSTHNPQVSKMPWIIFRFLVGKADNGRNLLIETTAEPAHMPSVNFNTTAYLQLRLRILLWSIQISETVMHLCICY